MVTVMVTGAATAADINVEDIIICEEESAILTPTSSLANPIFNWYRNADKTDKVSNQNIGAVTYVVAEDDVLTINGLLAENSYTYYVSVEGDGICDNTPNVLKAATVTVTHQHAKQTERKREV